MNNQIKLIIPFAIFCLAAIGALSADTSNRLSNQSHSPTGRGCLPPDSTAFDLREELIALMGRTDPLADTILSAEGVVRVPTSEITLVFDSTLCRRAADAYNAAESRRDTNRKVHVVKAGIRFVVLDPANRAGEYETGITFDSSFIHTLSKFAY